MYKHTTHAANGAIISTKQREEPLHNAPEKEYESVEAQLAAEMWDLRGTELWRREAPNATPQTFETGENNADR